MKYDSGAFGGRLRGDFIRALEAEGIPCTPGYGLPLSEEGGMKRLRDLYPHLVQVDPCPNVEATCKSTVWLYQNQLLGSESDMNDIIEAVMKIQRAFRQ